MVGEDHPTAPPERSSVDGDPFGALPPGTRLGKYEIVSSLGQGGFGITYRARDTQLDRDVAIKEYLPTTCARRQSGNVVVPRSTQTAEDFLWGRARFLDEAKTLAKLEDAPGIVSVYEFMEAYGTAYMVMTLVRGETLEARLKRDRRLPQPAVELLLYPLLEGLEVVHDAGFLHRDIKPANILIDQAGRPALIDFGASRLALQGRTQAMTAVYTPGYAAPEQMTSSGRQGPWTDIYALAGTLYHCVSGRTPPSAIERLAGDAMDPAIELGKGRYGPSLLAAIDAGLRLKAPDRPQTIADWQRTLSGVVAQASVAPTREIDALTRPVEGGPTRRMRPGGWRTRRIAAAAATVLVLAAVAGGAWLTWRPTAETPAEALRRAEEEARRRADVVTKLRQEEEARQRAAADAARQAEQEAARKAEEEKAAAEAAARRRSEEAERQRAAAEAARRQAEQDAARQAAAEREAEAIARRKAEEEAAVRAAAEAVRRRTDKQGRAEAEADARLKAEAEAARRRAKDQAQAEAETKRKAEQAVAARRAAEEQARVHAETAAVRRRQKEERRGQEEAIRVESIAREAAKAEAHARAEEQARRKAEEDARRKAEEDARRRAEEDAQKTADDIRRQGEAAEVALRLTEPDRRRIQVALTALGHDTRGTDGTFGPRTRQMIAAWQRKQGAPDTGHLTALQLAALHQQAAPALARYDEDQKRLEDDKRRQEEEARRKQDDDARRSAQPSSTRQQPAAGTPQTAATPQPSSKVPADPDGQWSGHLDCGSLRHAVVLEVRSGRAQYRQGETDLTLTIRVETVSADISGILPTDGRPVQGRLTGQLVGKQLRATGELRSKGGSAQGAFPCTLTAQRTS